MPPSAGACQTTLADVSPDCGRASNWSSTITAITCRFATSGVTRFPVSGAGTRLGVGWGVGSGGVVGLGDAVGSGTGDGEGEAVGSGVDVGAGDGEVLAIATGSGVASGLMIPPATTPRASPTPSVPTTTRP